VLKWERYKKSRQYMQEVVIPAFDGLGLDSVTRALRRCGEYVNIIQCVSCKANHFAGYIRCKSRWCIPCNHVRALMWVARLFPIFKEWLDGGKRVCMLNLTVKNGESLKEVLSVLLASWRELYHGTKTREKWKERFKGGIRSLEVKRGKNSGLWHPHLHCLVLQDTWEKDFYWLRDRWKELIRAKGYEGSVWIVEVKNNRLGVIKAILETLKYIVKPEQSIYEDREDLKEVFLSLTGVRQVSTWGVLRGVSGKVEKDIDKIEQKKLAEFVCRKCGCTEGELKQVLHEVVGDLFDL